MTEAETGKLLAVIAEVYPKFKEGRNIPGTIKLWQKVFANDSYREAEAAFMAFVSTDEKGFPPPPGKLKAIISTCKKPEGDMDELEAWAMVQKALRNSIYNCGKEYAALPPEIQSCIGSAMTLRDWAMMDTETINSVVASNFMRSYRARASHVREVQKLPPAVREVFGLLGEAMRLPDAQQKPAVLPEAQEEQPEPVYSKDGWKLARERIMALRVSEANRGPRTPEAPQARSPKPEEDRAAKRGGDAH